MSKRPFSMYKSETIDRNLVLKNRADEKSIILPLKYNKFLKKKLQRGVLNIICYGENCA